MHHVLDVDDRPVWVQIPGNVHTQVSAGCMWSGKYTNTLGDAPEWHSTMRVAHKRDSRARQADFGLSW